MPSRQRCSAVTLAAARAHGDEAPASDLDREAELFGLPLDLGGGRRFLGGVLPVGDAWVAWARSVPEASSSADLADPRARVWLWAVPGLAVAAVSMAAILVVRDRRRVS